ncbi:hypothetical protein HU200_007602 [Digitaria exilis]|uniref:Pentatricopeptide repeat-containing protein n=1 Tax=Digitaria exilis TaxID=1010633 RepID=A0A835FMI9_9POAL|nr:hypothetical protein HU200_007602 [Digitaria exilis]
MEPSSASDSRETKSPFNGDHDRATASDGALELRREPGRKERAGDRAGVIAERNVKGAVEEWQVMRVRSAHEGREVDEINARDVPHAGRVERRAREDSPRRRIQRSGAKADAERAAPQRIQRGDARSLARRRSGSTTRRDAASQEVRGNGARDSDDACADETQEEEDEWRNSCSSAAVATAAMAIDTRFSSRRTCPSVAPVRLVGAVEGGAAPRDATRNEWAQGTPCGQIPPVPAAHCNNPEPPAASAARVAVAAKPPPAVTSRRGGHGLPRCLLPRTPPLQLPKLAPEPALAQDAAAGEAEAKSVAAGRNRRKPLGKILRVISEERDPDKLVSQFIAASTASPRFRDDRRVYEVAVSRLTSFGRRDAKPFEASSEDFATRLLRLYGRASLASHATATFLDLPQKHKSVTAFNALLAAYVDSGEFDKLVAAFQKPGLSTALDVIPLMENKQVSRWRLGTAASLDCAAARAVGSVVHWTAQLDCARMGRRKRQTPPAPPPPPFDMTSAAAASPARRLASIFSSATPRAQPLKTAPAPGPVPAPKAKAAAGDAEAKSNGGRGNLGKPLTKIVRNIFRERDPDKLVSQFIAASSASQRFRHKHRVYEVSVARLVSFGRHDAITTIIDSQKPFLEASGEGFAACLVRLYGRAGMPSHAAATFHDLPPKLKSVKTFDALLAAYVDAGELDALDTAFRQIPASHPTIKPDLSAALDVIPLMEKCGIKPDVISWWRSGGLRGYDGMQRRKRRRLLTVAALRPCRVLGCLLLADSRFRSQTPPTPPPPFDMASSAAVSPARRLSRIFSSAKPRTQPPKPSPAPASKAAAGDAEVKPNGGRGNLGRSLVKITKAIFRERDPDKLVSQFVAASSASRRFRDQHRVYEVAVARLASFGRHDAITAIIDAQKPFLEATGEGFAARLVRLYGRAGMPSHAAATFHDLPPKLKSVMTFNALLAAYVDAGDLDTLATAFRQIPASDPTVKPDLSAAVDVISLMEKCDINPDEISFNTLLNGFYNNESLGDDEREEC